MSSCFEIRSGFIYPPCALPNLASVDFLCPGIEFLGNLSSAGGGKEKNVTLPPPPPPAILPPPSPSGIRIVAISIPSAGGQSRKDFTGGQKMDKEFFVLLL